MKSRALVLAAVALFMTALTASAQIGTWTAVGSTGTVEPTQVGLFGTFGGTRLGFNPALAAAATITARFNVTNTWGGGMRDTPPWTMLEVGALNTNTGVDLVAATLYRVDPCTGNRTAICTAINNVAGGNGACVTCTFASTTFNFANFLYYVEVSITRMAANGNPQLSTLRIR
jgi:hypothetical protein